MNYIIVDDEPIAHTIIQDYAASLSDLTLLGNCYNAIDALSLLQKQKVDLIFLDIEMPKLKGLDFLRTLTNPPLIVITSAYSEFAVESYELEVCDYLLKPFSFERFLKAYTKVIKTKEQSSQKSKTVTEATNTSIFLKGDKETHHIQLDHIKYLESYGSYVKLYLQNEMLLIHESISHFETVLSPDEFIRVHRSFIVNITSIKSIVGNQIKLEGITVPIGQSYKAIIKNKLF
ncbi:LytTR family DNA-binding domain-containing protein [Aquimarina sp. 2201CG5-10]|uniref:LytR/AlgR family response regulator transcription factor n=1 Tax=Aquimarina callyspongiae TaxID=3098150 RepID=UPI002AB5A4CF|nr:LytTR family DNA-binding domain-containing protein [Aquimarina sp. 2201CG5-10]MDY8135278.1 LytTR family DNA-binding domain-containing protein [Aquimarina sp. 2201CG5-10]